MRLPPNRRESALPHACTPFFRDKLEQDRAAVRGSPQFLGFGKGEEPGDVAKLRGGQAAGLVFVDDGEQRHDCLLHRVGHVWG